MKEVVQSGCCLIGLNEGIWLRCLAFQVSLIIHPSFLDSTNLVTCALIVSLSVVIDNSKSINIHR